MREAIKFAGPVAHGVSDPLLQLVVTSTPPLYSPPPGAFGVQEAPGVLWAEPGLSLGRAWAEPGR